MKERAFEAFYTSLPSINISHNHFENCTSQTIDIVQTVHTSIFLENNVWINCIHSGYDKQILDIDCDGFGTTIQRQDSIRTVYNTKKYYLEEVWDESSIYSTNVSDISLFSYSSLVLAPRKDQSASQKFMIYSRIKAADDVIVFFPQSGFLKDNVSSSNFVELDAGNSHFYSPFSLVTIEDSFISVKEGQDSIKCNGEYGGFLFQNCCLKNPISSFGVVSIENSKDFSKCTMIPVPPESDEKPEQFSFHLNFANVESLSKFLFFSPFSLLL